MTFTYTAGGETDLDRIRIRIGDTDRHAVEDLRLEDEEIEDFLATEGGFFRSAAAAAEALAAKFSRKAEGSQGPDRVVPSDRANHLRRIAAQLRSAAAAGCVPVAGGTPRTTGKEPAFRRGLLDNPDA